MSGVTDNLSCLKKEHRDVQCMTRKSGMLTQQNSKNKITFPQQTVAEFLLARQP